MNKLAKDLWKNNQWNSRKYRTAWYLTLLFSALFVVPALVTLVLVLLGWKIDFALLSGPLYVGFITTVWGVYFGANLTEKLKAFRPKPKPSVDLLDSLVEDAGAGRGGQPEDII